tara:strand:- start:736 stop:1398 length:663 start_codon:yes stop_codon:yes gene_type:complete
MKIYSKIGDMGMTYLSDGTRVVKNNVIIKCLGEFDELNSDIAFIIAILENDKKMQYLINNGIKNNSNINKYYNILKKIQYILFDISKIISRDIRNENIKDKMLKFDYNNENLKIIEKYIDELTNEMSELSNLILPGGNILIASIDRARTKCRSAERRLSSIHYYYYSDINILSEIDNINILNISAYINRLSDYLYILARYTGFILNIKYNIYEIDNNISI